MRLGAKLSLGSSHHRYRIPGKLGPTGIGKYPQAQHMARKLLVVLSVQKKTGKLDFEMINYIYVYTKVYVYIYTYNYTVYTYKNIYTL